MVSAAVALGIIAGPAAAAASAAYTATISPTAVTAGTAKTYTVTITNPSLLPELLGINHATVTVPSGFTGVGIGTPTPPGSTATYNSSTRVVTINSPLLFPGASLTVPITATAPTSTGTYTWPTTATAFLGGHVTRSGPDPTVQVASSVVICPAGHDCTSGNLTAGPTPFRVGTSANVLAPNDNQNDVLITNLPDPVVTSMVCTPPADQPSQTDGQVVGWSLGNRESTLTYTIQPQAPYTAYPDSLCFGSAKQFVTGDHFGNPTESLAQPNNGEFEGTLPLCSNTLPVDTRPCLVSIVRPEDGDDAPGSGAEPEDGTTSITWTVLAPAGDPHAAGG